MIQRKIDSKEIGKEQPDTKQNESGVYINSKTIRQDTLLEIEDI